jgi:hypothetical protein
MEDVLLLGRRLETRLEGESTDVLGPECQARPSGTLVPRRDI